MTNTATAKQVDYASSLARRAMVAQGNTVAALRSVAAEIGYSPRTAVNLAVVDAFLARQDKRAISASIDILLTLAEDA